MAKVTKVDTEKTNKDTAKKTVRSKTKTVKRKSKENPFIRKEIKGLLIIVAAILLLLQLLGYSLGFIGDWFGVVFKYIFGVTNYFLVMALLLWGWRLLYRNQGLTITYKGLLITGLIISMTSYYVLFAIPFGQELIPQNLLYPGLVTSLYSLGLRKLFGTTGAWIVNIAATIIICILLTKISVGTGLRKAGTKASKVGSIAKEKAEIKIAEAKEQLQIWQEERANRVYDQTKDPRYPVSESEFIDKNKEVEESIEFNNQELTDSQSDIMAVNSVEICHEEKDEHEAEVEFNPCEFLAEEELKKTDSFDIDDNVELTTDSDFINEETNNLEEQVIDTFNEVESENIMIDNLPKYEGAGVDTSEVAVTTEEVNRPRRIELPYHFPPIEILARGKQSEDIDVEVSEKAALLEATLEDFGIKAKVINATKGPAVTRYELEPARGVKVSKIVNLTDDIALNLAATGIRMEAPIPGKAAIGIEIPNKSVSSVNLRDVLDCDEFLNAKGGIPVGLGKDIAGKAIITDLAKMPHLLVAGSTGSGKSVCINTLISSILFRRKPDEVKLILIDPKMVELSNYNGVPHLMAPVVTDMKKAASVLNWAVREMDSRYRTFADLNVRDIKRYNELYPESHMPFIVLIIDELADLMMVSPVDIEDSICRLAQKARAAGIHLVLATQRPSVDVITGTIKANVPSRISFAVSSQIDSRTILDMAGAEKLLGKGDMLFNPIGASKPVRIQGAFISDDEVERLVEFLKNQGYAPEYEESITAIQEESSFVDDSDIVEDELLYDAIEYVLDAGQASTSMLQRKMRIGFTRAGRLMDTMEQMKIIGPHVGSKPRELLMSRAQIEEIIMNKR